MSAHRKPGKMTGGFRFAENLLGQQVLEVQVYAEGGGTKWVRADRRQAQHLMLNQRIMMGR